MNNLQIALTAIDGLTLEEVTQVEAELAARRARILPQKDDAEVWIADLHAVIAEFKDGLSDEELQAIAADMNIGYISPKELHLLDEIAAWAEDEA